MPRTYPTPLAFKAALEHRLRTAVEGHMPIERRRQLLVFDLFLARVVEVLGDAITLKGGLVLELRLSRARTTKDVDLRFDGSPGEVLAKLQEAGRRDIGDFMQFEVQRDATHPEIQNDGMKYGGLRFRAECRLAGGDFYGQRFGVDVAFGDPMARPPDEIVADDVLAFVGVAPPKLRLYPIETHIAEKLHAYTMPRQRPNTRVKDLPDSALLSGIASLEAVQLHEALELTFSFRATHSLPTFVPEPNAEWAIAYQAIAREDGLPWKTLDDVTAAIRAFLNPVLAGERAATWDPARRAWV